MFNLPFGEKEGVGTPSLAYLNAFWAGWQIAVVLCRGSGCPRTTSCSLVARRLRRLEKKRKLRGHPWNPGREHPAPREVTP